MQQSWFRSAVAAGAVILGGIPNAFATTVIQLGTTELLTASEFVFEGEAIDIRVGRSPATGQISTLVTFSVHDVIKGDYVAPTIELSFAGGRLESEAVGIAGMVYPTLGERGVYFVEQTGRTQVHPIYGWSQGHFIVDDPASGDAASVHTIGFRPVYDLTLTSVDFGTQYSAGRARGLIVDAPFEGARPLALGDFKAKLRGFMRQLDIPEPVTRQEDPR